MARADNRLQLFGDPRRSISTSVWVARINTSLPIQEELQILLNCQVLLVPELILTNGRGSRGVGRHDSHRSIFPGARCSSLGERRYSERPVQDGVVVEWDRLYPTGYLPHIFHLQQTADVIAKDLDRNSR